MKNTAPNKKTLKSTQTSKSSILKVFFLFFLTKIAVAPKLWSTKWDFILQKLTNNKLNYNSEFRSVSKVGSF